MARPTEKIRFDPECRKCARLVRYLEQVRRGHPDYYCKPVPSFGDPDARLMIVGLAPGKHGANATGRPFTGDHAGILLYRTLYKFGFADGEASHSADDGLTLTDCRITNAVKCLPPENKPTNAEVIECNRYLRVELDSCAPASVVLALGLVAHKSVLRAFNLTQARFPFGHGQVHSIDKGIILLDSYHCSRYNTQTGRLTRAMFEQVFRKAREMIS